MKKLSILVCFALILQVLCGCGSREEFMEPANFYYCRSETSYHSPSSVIQSETREGSAFRGDLQTMLKEYLKGPETPELNSLIPAGTTVQSCEITGDTVYLQMSSRFSSLSGIRLVLACSCILMTIHDYVGSEVLHISAKDSQLDDKDTFILRLEDIALMDVQPTDDF